MRTRSSRTSPVTRRCRLAPSSESRRSPASPPRTRMATKRFRSLPDDGATGKRMRGDDDLLIEHELQGRPGSKWRRMGIPSCSVYRGSVYQVGHTFSHLLNDIASGKVTSYPEEYVHSLAGEKFGSRVLDSVNQFVNKKGFVFYSSNTPLCLNLADAKAKPKGVLLDLILLTYTNLPVVFTVTDARCDDRAVTEYNHSLARELTYTMRDFTDEGFNIFDRIVDVKKFSKAYIAEQMHEVFVEYKRNFPIDRLCMSRDRCLALTRALLAQGFTSSVRQELETQVYTPSPQSYSSSTTLGTDTYRSSADLDYLQALDEDAQFLLTPEQFRLLNNCINTRAVWLVSSLPGTGKIRLALETANRLSLHAKTLVLCESEDFRKNIRPRKNLEVVTRSELQENPRLCQRYVNMVVVKAEQLEFQSGKELIFDWHFYLEKAINNSGGKLVIVYDRRDEQDLDESSVQALETRKQQLKSCLIPDDVVLELLSKKVMSIKDLIWIKKRTTREQQNEDLVRSLMSTSKRGYDIFLRVLRKTRQGHLADLLETDGDCHDMVMSAEHTEHLQAARDVLVHCMIPFGVLGRLYRRGVFTSSDISRIQAEESIDQMNAMLLDYLAGKPDRCFALFIEALADTCQENLKDFLISGKLAGPQVLPSDHEKFKSHTRQILIDKVDLEELLLELECACILYKDDLRYILFGNNIKAFLDKDKTTPESSTSMDQQPKVNKVSRLLELLSRKLTCEYDTLLSCLRRTGQYEAVQDLQHLQGISADHHMDTTEEDSNYRALDVKFIETKAFQAVQDKLRDPSEVFIVLTGAPGEGKTTAAYQAMRHQGLQKIRKHVIKSPSDFNRLVSLDAPVIVLLDDVFGIVEVNEAAVKSWIPVLQKIKKHAETGNRPQIHVMITSRNHVWREAESLEDLKDIIPLSSVIDFTVLVPLNRAEKKRMLDSHLDKHQIVLGSSEVETIADTDGTLGFPLCCKLFAAEPMFQDNPVDFFTNPISYIVKVLISSCEDPSNLTLIKQVVMSKGQLDRTKAEVGSINDQSVLKMKNYVFQEGSILYFPHKSIQDAASYVMATKFSIDYVGEYSLQFLYERVREKPARGVKSSDPSDIQIHVNQKDMQSLICRLATEMSAGNLALACSHPALTTMKSVEKLFVQFKDISGTLKQKDKKHAGSFLYWTTWNSSENLCKEALKHGPFPCQDMCEAILGCCLSGNINALKELLKHTQISKVSDCGIQYLPKISTRQQLVANESVRVIEISGERMAHLACKYGNTEIVQVLMQHDLDINAKDRHGETCLLSACIGDNLNAVSFLLENNALWSQDNDGHSPLHLAIEKDKVDMLRLLLDHQEAKEFLDRKDKDGQSPLHLACLNKSPEMVEMLLEKGADINIADSCGWTPLHYIAWIGNKKILDILVKHKADVNAACKESSAKPKSPLKLRPEKGYRETEGMTALHLASHQGHTGIVKKLTEVPQIDVNMTDVFGKSALYIASKRGHSPIVKILLEKKADTSLATSDRRTAVYAASKKGHAEVIKLLFDHKANVNTGTSAQRKRNPLYAASRKGYVTAIDCLLQNGADIHYKDSDGNTSLHIACAARQTDVVKCLIKRNANVMARNCVQQTALHDAVATKNPDADIIDYLLLAGADVNATDNSNWTPLHLASLCCSASVVKTLLLWKADVNARDKSDMTPIRYASAMGKVDNIALLLKYNARVDSVCLNLATIYGHADAVALLLNERLSVQQVNEMYQIAKDKGHDKVMDVITRLRPSETMEVQ